jgi:BlaI family transcriptional regulator, penicillinase repressor
MFPMRRSPSRPTVAELVILRVLWRRGPCTVRQVQETLEEDRPTGYTTALKFLQIMFEKGLVLRDESERSHVYRARVSEQQTQRLLLRDLADRAFDGSLAQLVGHALAMKPVSRSEAAEIRKHLRTADEPPVGERPAAPSTEPGIEGPGSRRLF